MNFLYSEQFLHVLTIVGIGQYLLDFLSREAARATRKMDKTEAAKS
jgi:hypothetical protein